MMDDRFKFRIPMFTDKDHFSEFQYIELGDNIECTLCGHNGKPQQCTGLKDKNGTLIYEGDIYTRKGHNGAKYLVKYHHTGLCGELINDGVMTLIAQNKEYYEIIGNIYENSELLK